MSRRRTPSLSVVRLFLCRLFADRGVWTLPVAAFAVVTALTLGVVGGGAFFFRLGGFGDPYLVDVYRVLAALALGLLLVPLCSLAASAARLLARRRDERLSSLRLLGASRGMIRTLAVAEAAVLAAAGAVVGLLGWLALMPLIGLLPFAGRRIGVAAQWLGLPATAGIVTGVVVLGALSALAGLRAVEVTPLGVRTRRRPERAAWTRVLLAVGLLVAAQATGTLMGASADMVTMASLLVVTLLVPLIGVQLLGPWVLAVVARRQVRRARTADRLVAARTVLESPKLAWRQVGGVALTTYVGTVGAAGFGLLSAAGTDSTGAGATGEDLTLMLDMRTGVLVTMVISFLLAGCSVAIAQAAQVLDRAELHRGLTWAGMPLRTLHAMRRRAVMSALGTVLTVSMVFAVVTAAPILGAGVLLAPASMLTMLTCLALGVLLVRLGVDVTRPALARSVT